jgi:hypothetical protein
MKPRYRVEVRPEAGDLVLYITKRYRHVHDGPYTESFHGRLTWENREVAQERIDRERERGTNLVLGPLIFSIVEESSE